MAVHVATSNSHTQDSGLVRRIEKQSRRSLDRYSPSSCSMYTHSPACVHLRIYIYVYTYTRVSGLTEIKLTGSSECIWRWPVQANRNDGGWQMAGREEGKIFRKLGDIWVSVSILGGIFSSCFSVLDIYIGWSMDEIEIETSNCK